MACYEPETKEGGRLHRVDMAGDVPREGVLQSAYYMLARFEMLENPVGGAYELRSERYGYSHCDPILGRRSSNSAEIDIMSGQPFIHGRE